MMITKTIAAAVALTLLTVAPAFAEFSGSARGIAEDQFKIDQSQWVLQPLKDEARAVCRQYIALNSERWQMQQMGAGTNRAAAEQPALYNEFVKLSQRENAALQHCVQLQMRAMSCLAAYLEAVNSKLDVADTMRRAAQREPGACLMPGNDR
jgi:hypothetical protein